MISKAHFFDRKDRIFCKAPELIENYDLAIADTENIWVCHHKKEEFYSRKELIEMGEYFNVKPEDLIFLTSSEHTKLHNNFRIYKKPTFETRKKNGNATRGKIAYSTPEGKRVFLDKNEVPPKDYIKGYSKEKGKLPSNFKKFKEARWSK